MAKQIAKYGGLLVNGKIVEPPKPKSRESEMSEDEEEYPAADGDETEKCLKARECIYEIKNERYVQKNHNMKWQLMSDCWRCQQNRYTVIFYQRSKSHIWFKKITDMKYVNVIPYDVLMNYREKIQKLNESFDTLQTPTEKRKQLVLDPVLIGNFEISKTKPMRNPHEYLDKLLRQEILSEVQKSLVA